MASDWLVRATVASNQKQKLVVATSPLTTQQYRVRTNTGWLGIWVMCPSGATCLPMDCCFGEPALKTH
jgi:hypothetical protein